MNGTAKGIGRWWRVPAWLVLLAAAAPAQDVFVHLDLRVSSSAGPGAVVIDRGAREEVAVGDLVNFFPRSGGVLRGAVSDVRDRSAVVQMHGGNAIPPLGTRGEVLLPKARLQQRSQPPQPQPQAQPQPSGEPDVQSPPAIQEPAEGAPPPATEPQDRPPPTEEPALPQLPQPTWRNRDEGFTQDMPLLAQVRPVKPSERPARVTGRAWFGSELTYSPHESLDNSWIRVGTDLDVENPFGRGGGLHVAGDLGYRTEWDDDPATKVLVRGLSYHEGGTRFEPHRWEAGRFLQYGVPEFGLLDGFEWTKRRANGDHLGASVGWLPELNADLNSFEDFQLAGFYEWQLDQYGQDAITAAFQKTWHHWSSDRDLLLLKAHHTPVDDWQVHATFWIDFYDGRDNNKGPVELTQALVAATRQWRTGSGVEFVYRRITFQETLRDEFLPLYEDELADNHLDRVSAAGWRQLSAKRRLHGEIGGYVDEDDVGGDVDVGYELTVFPGGTVDVSTFFTAGQFSNVIGVRTRFGWSTAAGHWDVFGEFADHHQHGFDADADDILQSRLRGSGTWYLASGWSLSLYGEGRQWDDELGATLGGYLERRF